jgi:DNA-binding Xre family transcriptional regulator
MKINFRVLLAAKEQDERRSISLKTASEESGVPMHTIRAFYKGNPRSVNPDHLEALCHYFKCPIGELLEIEPWGNSQPTLLKAA